MHVTTEERGVLGDHQMAPVRQDHIVRTWRCTGCGVEATHWFNAQSRYETRRWIDWKAPDGRTWYTDHHDGYGDPPTCPLPGVEALCPWDIFAHRYDGAWGDAQLDTAMRTWCERHQQAISECVDPGPLCPGHDVHMDENGNEVEPGRPGPCTGREESCRCMCPACCGDTPDMYGYDGDY